MAAVLLLAACGPSPAAQPGGPVSPSSSPSAAPPTATAEPTCTEHWTVSDPPAVPGPVVNAWQADLHGVGATGASDVWAVGSFQLRGSQRTLAEHWNGVIWSIVPVPDLAAPGDEPNDSLNAVAAVAADDVWAVGEARMGQTSQTLVEHWDGTRWSIVPAPDVTVGDQIMSDSLAGITVVSAKDIWAVGTTIWQARHSDGISSWTYSAGSAPLVIHWDGSRWSRVAAVDPVPAPTAADLTGPGYYTTQGEAAFNGVSATSGRDVWAVGMYRAVAPRYEPGRTLTEHWDGTRWTIVAAPDVQLGQSPEGVIWAEDTLNAVVDDPTTGVWAVGDAAPQGGLILHWENGEWHQVAAPATGSGQGGRVLTGVTAAGGHVWVVGALILEATGGSGAGRYAAAGRQFGSLTAITADRQGGFWAVGHTIVHRWCAVGAA